MAKNQDLPQEIMIEIFSRLPSKSIGKCRCLSKPWNSHLSTPQFINLHFTRKTHQENIILITQSYSLQTITSPIQYNAVSKKLESDDTWSQLLGSCNGLVLLANTKRDLCLVNPLTTQKVYIPDFDLALKTGDTYRIHGFGYDSCSDDYKIVAIPIYTPDDSTVMKPSDKFVDVYSVKRGFWKRVTVSYADVYVETDYNGALVNGAFHYLAIIGDNQFIIAAFDLANEVFYEIPAPASISGDFCALCVFGERLCLVDTLCEGSNRTDVWTMEKYGSVESWTKLCSIEENDDMEIVRPLCFIGDDEIVLETTCDQSWVVYNLKEGTVKELVVDGIPAHFMDGDIFFDSLVSLG